MSLLGILGLLFTGKSAIECAAENHYFKQRADRLPNGVEYWIDRKGQWRLCKNNEAIFKDGTRFTDIHGKVIYDSNEEQNQYARSKVTEKPYQPYRYAVQNNPRTRNPATTDLRTGKVVARVEDYAKKDGTHEYRKWYLWDPCAEKYAGQDLTYVVKVNPDFYNINDPGILITKEEYDAINNCPGLNSYNFRYHKNDYRSEW